MLNPKIIDLDISKLNKNPFQYRVEFDPDSIYELSNDILINGLNTPILVLFDSSKNKYYIIAGERRTIACKLANLESIKAEIIEGKIEDDNIQRLMKVKMYNENQLHKNPTPIEEGVSYRKDLRPTIKNNYRPSYASISQLVGFILNLNKVKTLTEEQNKIRLNKIKDISKKILEKAATTEYIENRIQEGGVDDNYLLVKVSILSQEARLTKVKARTVNEKKKSQENLYDDRHLLKIKHQDPKKYKKIYEQKKMEQMINKFYDDCNEFYLKNNFCEKIDFETASNFSDEEKTNYKNKIVLFKNEFKDFVDNGFNLIYKNIHSIKTENELNPTTISLTHAKINKTKNKINIQIEMDGIDKETKEVLEKELDKIYKILNRK